ncbi:hypothetical protein A6M21_09050 [Desulfotomaculum copahuensis]|uniref:Squalene cyclase C-terminal domain-containing protein n=2 Tax=Desulfotomaculum copahuensis TaxID=1838280 RepID=A0A1B7LFA0_9FIRM|nr:hypothetical protein A6M21_09050 [Desulfotomaculum copahuensis]
MMEPDVLSKGLRNDAPYTHRKYLDAAALGLAGKLTNDNKLTEESRKLIKDGIKLQLKNGVNPEKGGYDSSYQMVGVVYAERWLVYFKNDPLKPDVENMIEKALKWEESRILKSGVIDTSGNTRVEGQGKEKGPNDTVKTVSYSFVVRGFAFWAVYDHDKHSELVARKVASGWDCIKKRKAKHI